MSTLQDSPQLDIENISDSYVNGPQRQNTEVNTGLELSTISTCSHEEDLETTPLLGIVTRRRGYLRR